MKLKQKKILMKFFIKTKIYLILVIIQKIQCFMILSIWTRLVKWKMSLEGKINIEFVGSKMYSSTDVDGKENKKGKGVNSVVVNNQAQRIS